MNWKIFEERLKRKYERDKEMERRRKTGEA